MPSVKFRGEDVDVEIDFDGGYEFDTNAHVIGWHFAGMTPEQHDALNVTDDEEQSIYEQLVEHSRDCEGDDFDLYLSECRG